MRKRLLQVLLFAAITATVPVFSQTGLLAVQDTTPDNVLFEKQWSLGVMLHTNGWGLKFRRGKNITYLKQFLWEIEFSTMKSSKEIRTINPYFSDAKSYIYGKVNYAYFLRGGVGFNRVLNSKPYWGGVQVSWLGFGGLSLGITKPVYLYILYYNQPYYDYSIRAEKYNPDQHFLDNIYGRAPFLTGITELSFHPGIYVKTGLDFEFGAMEKRIQSLEVGVTVDFSPLPITIMAYNPKQYAFLTAYLAFSLGKRFNK
jgi:hypothetical protein